jgi:hypothetical protein
MGRLDERAKGIRRLLTASELQNLVGKPFAPCSECGNGLLAVLHNGQIVCEDCNPDSDRIVPLRLLAFSLPSGSVVGVDYDKHCTQKQKALEMALEDSTIEIHEIETAPCPVCGGIEPWWDILGNLRCMKCSPLTRKNGLLAHRPDYRIGLEIVPPAPPAPRRPSASARRDASRWRAAPKSLKPKTSRQSKTSLLDG